MWTPLATGTDCGSARQPFAGPEAGAPSAACTLAHTAGAAAFFGLLLPDRVLTNIVKNTNAYAGSKGLFSDDCQPTNLLELKAFIGLLIRLGVCPTHDVQTWWSDPRASFCFGDARVHGVMTGTRFTQLRRMLHLSPLTDPKDKFGTVLDDVRVLCKAMWTPGKTVSIDEQTIGCQARNSAMTRIKFKREGDGYQLDTVCDGEYTISWWARWMAPPPDNPNVAPTYARMLWLVKELGGRWNHIYCDNLYVSEMVLRGALALKAYVAGTCRAGGRGFPPIAMQAEQKKATLAAAAKGTIKAAVSGDGALVAVSVYDSKPVNMMSSIHTKVEMLDKTRLIWDAAAQARVPITFKRLNVVDDYNFGMNSVDLADKARMLYRPDTYLRFRKWWWSIFVWLIGLVALNAYVLYAAKTRAQGLNPCTHKEFRARLAEQLCNPARPPSGGASSASAASGARSRRVDKEWRTKFGGRATGGHEVHPFQKSKTDCQLCKAETGKSVVAHLNCRTCQVNFCLGKCWETWHTT